MAFPNGIYAPPGPYTQTFFENPTQALLTGLKLPIYIGTGSEILTQENLEVIRGSSSSVDQRIVEEDLDGRSVVSVLASGAVVLGDFNGVRKQVQVRHYPIVNGDGTGTTARRTSDVSVTLNGVPIVVLSMDGAKGLLELSTAPNLGDTVRVTYFFNRTDTLITDNLTEQVTEGTAQLYGGVGESYTIETGVNDELIVVIDRDSNVVTITVPSSGVGTWTASQLASFINSGAVGTSLVASTFENNFGNIAILLTADEDLTIGSGTVNSTIGFSNGQTTARNRVFYTFNGPIVDGSNGGITTTDPTDVTVLVDGTQVIPTAVDGSSRAITLPWAPKADSIVLITYYFNTWQDTFDYLAHRNITDIIRCGVTPDRTDYTDGVDFILENDLIVWGTAATVATGEHTDGTNFFNTSQITPTLIDNKAFLELCAPVVNQSVSPAQETRTQFTLPLQPTTGNGRNSPLGTDLYNTVSNGRVDLPTNRPDLVTAYWGFGIQDAINRGPVEVLQVESSSNTIRLALPVPVGAQVYCTFYYNTINDAEFTLAVEVPGAGGVGSYTVSNQQGTPLLTAQFGAKSAGLAGVQIQFPSGSETKPDARYEGPFSQTQFQGAVEEDVTVTFSSKDSTLAKFTVPGAGPYFPIAGASDNLDVEIDGAAVTGGFIDLNEINGVPDLGFHASLIGEEIVYDADSGYTTYDIDATNNEVNLTVDGVLIEVSLADTPGATLSDFVTGINASAATTAPQYVSAAKFTSAVTIVAGEYDTFSFDYTGDAPTLPGVITATVAPAIYSSATALAVAVDAAIVSAIAGAGAGFAVAVTANANGQLVFALTKDGADTSGYLSFIDPADVQATATATINVLVLVPGDIITIGGVPLTANAGVLRTPGADDFDPTTPGTAILLADEIVSAINDGANSFTGIATADNAGGTSAVITLTAVAVGALGNAVTLTTTLTTPADITLSGALFAGGSDSPANAFAVLAGIDTAASKDLGQLKLVDGPIARRYTVPGDNTGALTHDRLILRNRLVPGNTTVSFFHALGQAGIEVEGSLGTGAIGMPVGLIGSAGRSGTVEPASVLMTIGFSDGQASGFLNEKDGQPVVTFYADGGTQPQNNVFKFTMDNVPMTVEFTDGLGVAIPVAGSADVPIGPALSLNTIINQIATVMATSGFGASAAAVIAAGLIWQEGAGIRIVSSLSSTVSSVVIGSGSANNPFNISNGVTGTRTTVEPDRLASALMAHAGATISVVLNDTWNGTGPTAGYFAAEALATVETNNLGADFLFVQSAPATSPGLGTASSVVWREAAADSVTLPGVGLGIEAGDSAVGEAGTSGIYVTSSDPIDGSGTANNSLLNAGTGQDGVVGQTYRDLVTGLTFAVLPREGGTNYPDGSSFSLLVRRIVTTDSNLPISTIPGVELLVTNTNGIGAGDTAVVTTFDKNGAEPGIGDLYYVTYQYLKQDFSTQLYTKFSSIEAAYGALSPDNPVSLGAFLALTNGAVLIGIKQVQKDTDLNGDGIPDTASTQAFVAAVDDLEGPLPGNLLPNILVPLKGDDVDFFAYVARHCDIQSLIRNRAERTAIAGVTAGVEPKTAGDIAQAVGRARFRLVYPDIVFMPLPRADGTDEEVLVDGTFLASGLAGAIVSPNVDVATPWTGRRLFGYNQLARVLDAVEQNQVAVRGVTVLEDRPPVLRVRQGLTTDLTSILTKTPTVVQIVDETQQQTRAALERFIGIKFLPGVLSQIEGQLSTTLRHLVAAQILSAYTGVRANSAPDDPTVAEVEAFIAPVFPLLYIVVTFNLRSQI